MTREKAETASRPRLRAASTSGDLVADIYEMVRKEITTGTLRVGDRVTEVDLAERFGVSRTPVRDAISRLEADGLLTNEPRRGLVVSVLSHQQSVELYFMREILEGAAARLAAQSASDIELSMLEELSNKEMSSLDDVSALIEINRNFHRLMMLAAHNRYLLRSLSQLTLTMSLLPSLLDKGERARSAAVEHRAIVDALLARDREAAEEAARRHVRASQQHRMLFSLETDPAV
ncbi:MULTISPECIES: GntR family transcriptional regulator [Gemmobacter]|jgi:DNA-binding GntR family transcriptional regulator|uniref:GntR family transcriptional regulator n=1 Tax=Gemmobacter nanjingensis TaxID=488454 RepID=A0ABQ3FII2_9RHOB|nr:MULTISPECIES: GntR family transcriptional regulator [Gemmobacter]OJY34832.1 MAG: GntR family transcriptional regulator [Rhodobacterales bacterium 65-51]GHC25291.1 GntR family transcriptional regulator [Gemmobacter nanjingensis]